MRDIPLESTIYMDFTTRAFTTGVPTTLAGTPVLSVLEENNATPITAGVSVSVDRASVAGLNMAGIVATAANGYENGKGYSIYISTGTVGGVSVIGEVVGQFTIGASAAAVDLANGTDGLGAIKGDTAAIKTKTDFLPSATAGDAGGLFIAGTNAATTVTTSFTTTFTGNLTGSVASVSGAVGSVTGNVGGSTASVTGAVGSVTGAVGSVTGNVGGNVTGSVGSLGATAKTDVNIAVNKTQMTESYAADNVAPTLEQATFLTMQNLQEFAIAGTTITTKKIDGSATAATYTLDDGTNPTSRTRTT